MRQSTKKFTNKGSELNLDPSETPIRGPGARRKTSSAASRGKNTSANSNTSVASRASVVRHVAPQNIPLTNIGKQNLSSNSESDQTDTDSNNITGPQKPINIPTNAQTSHILGPKKFASNIPTTGAGQNIPVVKSTDTDNDFPTTDFNDEELNDLNRTGDKPNVAASVPAFSAPGGTQSGEAEAYTDQRSGNAQFTSVSASVPVLRKKMYTDGSSEPKPSPDIRNESQKDTKEAFTDTTSETVKKAGTPVSDCQKPNVISQSEAQSAYFQPQYNNSKIETRTPCVDQKTVNSSSMYKNVRSETDRGSSESSGLSAEIRRSPVRIPSLTHESIDDDMLFDQPSLNQKQRTLSDRSGGLLSPPTPRTVPRIPQDPSVEPEIPAVLPAKSSDLTTFSQRSPRWFLQNQNHNNNRNINQQQGFRPEPVIRTPKEDEQTKHVGANKQLSNNKPANQYQILVDNADNKTKESVIERADSFLENRRAVLERYMTDNNVPKQSDNSKTNNKENSVSSYSQSSMILEKLDKLSQKGTHADMKTCEKEEVKEPISTDWFLTPADHDTHVAASVSKPKGIGDDRVGLDSKETRNKHTDYKFDGDQTDLKAVGDNCIPVEQNPSKNKSIHSDSGIVSAASDNSVNKTDSSRPDERNQRGYFSDSGAKPKLNLKIGSSDRNEPSYTHRQVFNNSPVFKDIVSGSPTDLKSNSPLLERADNSSSPFSGKSSNGVIKTEKIKAGAVFSPIHPQPVTSAGLAKSTVAVSKDIVHPTPMAKAAASTDSHRKRSKSESGTTNGTIDLK